MAEKIFKERFCEITKTKVCTTSADINFDNYTEPGIYEIFEDAGNGCNKLYLMQVDNSADADAGRIKQTRMYCGKVETRRQTADGTWTTWEAVTGAGGTAGGYYIPDVIQTSDDTVHFRFTPSEATMEAGFAAVVTLPRGATGADGANGKSPRINADGYWEIWGGDLVGWMGTPYKAAPEKGVDYWTDEDKAEVKSYVDEAILGGEW